MTKKVCVSGASQNTIPVVFILAPLLMEPKQTPWAWCFFRSQMVFFSAPKEIGPEKVPLWIWWFCVVWCFFLPQTVLFRSPKVLILAPNGVFFCPKARFNSKRCFFWPQMVFFLARFTFESTHACWRGEVPQLRCNPTGEYSAAISLLWYEPERTVVCNQSSHYAKTLKVSAALQSVFFGTNLNGRWHAVSFSTMLKP